MEEEKDSGSSTVSYNELDFDETQDKDLEGNYSVMDEFRKVNAISSLDSILISDKTSCEMGVQASPTKIEQETQYDQKFNGDYSDNLIKFIDEMIEKN